MGETVSLIYLDADILVIVHAKRFRNQVMHTKTVRIAEPSIKGKLKQLLPRSCYLQ